jgi:hypothetical protein
VLVLCRGPHPAISRRLSISLACDGLSYVCSVFLLFIMPIVCEQGMESKTLWCNKEQKELEDQFVMCYEAVACVAYLF